jgi:formylglycine-generating enzyme required for sulfatase activity
MARFADKAIDLWNRIPNPRAWALLPWILGFTLGAASFRRTLDLPLPAAAVLWATALMAGLFFAFRAKPLLWEPGDQASKEQAPAEHPAPTPAPPPPLLDMVSIPGDIFRMGTPPVTDAQIKENAIGWSEDDARRWIERERPAHRVRVSPFSMARTPVTRSQWRAVMPDAPPEWEAKGADGDLPATHVDWRQALAFCNALSQREGLTDCYRKDEQDQWHWNRTADGYRLPTEAEWEYACRAGTETHWYWGNSARQAKKHAWLDTDSKRRLHPVGSKKANPWGLQDMAGLVFEWCWDRYGGYAEEGDQPVVNPEGPLEGAAADHPPVAGPGLQTRFQGQPAASGAVDTRLEAIGYPFKEVAVHVDQT